MESFFLINHKIDLQFNADKSTVLLFNSKESEHAPVRLGNAEVELVNSIVYLGLPFGRSITETRWLLMAHFHKRVSYIYSRIVANKQKFDHQI